MQPFVLISMVLAATQVFAAPTPTTDWSIGDGFELTDFTKFSGVQHQARSSLSNAERFARALPPAPPKRGHDHGRRTGASPVPQVTRRGVIEVSNVANGAVLGYISKHSLNSAQYQTYTASVEDAQILSFQGPVAATSFSSVDFTAENGDTGFPFLGLIQGRDSANSDIGPSSFHYLYVGGTNQTPADSTPQSVGNSYTAVTGLDRTSESAVWNVDLTTGALTIQWVNTDGSKPATYTWTQSTALYAGGSPDLFHSRYPAPVTVTSYKWIPL